MMKNVIGEKTATKIVKSTVICNVCGGEWEATPDLQPEAEECVRFGAYGGYHNRHWGDCSALRWHACQDCVAAWIATFAIPPEREEDFEPFRYGDEQRLKEWLHFAPELSPAKEDPVLTAAIFGDKEE